MSLVLCVAASNSAQTPSIMSSGVIENGVSLEFEISSTTYKKNNTITITYEVQNKRKQSIYLITGEALAPGYDLDKQELSASLYKFVVSYDFFALPKLKRIGPGEKHKGEADLKLDFLSSHFKAGNWFVYLSMGYLDNSGMAQIRADKARFPQGSAQHFERLQKVIQAGPIKLELIQ